MKNDGSVYINIVSLFVVVKNNADFQIYRGKCTPGFGVLGEKYMVVIRDIARDEITSVIITIPNVCEICGLHRIMPLGIGICLLQTI